MEVPFPSLLGELKKYGIKAKAERVYYLCLEARKYTLANKIAAKYRLGMEGYDDTIIAMGLSLKFSNGTL